MFSKLLGWLRSLLVKNTPTSPVDVYDVKERLIYSYFDGQKLVRVDPLVYYRRVMDKGPELDLDIKLANSPSKASEKGRLGVLTKIRSIFGVKPFEEGGLTESETTDLLDHFLLYCESLKKNSNPTPIPPTATSAPTASSSPVPSPTPNTSDSGSTATVSSTEPLVPLSSPSA